MKKVKNSLSRKNPMKEIKESLKTIGTRDRGLLSVKTGRKNRRSKMLTWRTSFSLLRNMLNWNNLMPKSKGRFKRLKMRCISSTNSTNITTEGY